MVMIASMVDIPKIVWLAPLVFKIYEDTRFRQKFGVLSHVVYVCRSRMILDDFREAYYWLRQNTADEARVMSWWDYGYQIAGMGNKTTLVDNNTWNNSHIALV